MTRDEAAKLLNIIRAYSMGGTVQYKSSTNEWKSMSSPSFEGSPDAYRIKPRPRVLYALVSTDTARAILCYAQSRSSVENQMKYYENVQIIKLVEEV